MKKTRDTAPSLRLEWRRPKELEDNPRNWRRHPKLQRSALRDVIKEVGWAGALLYNERTGRLIDGHARKEVAKSDEPVPVLIGSWDEKDEVKILATLDPLAAMAERDTEAWCALLADLQTESQALRTMLELSDDLAPKLTKDVPNLESQYLVVVTCTDEMDQRTFIEQMHREHRECKALLS